MINDVGDIDLFMLVMPSSYQFPIGSPYVEPLAGAMVDAWLLLPPGYEQSS